MAYKEIDESNITLIDSVICVMSDQLTSKAGTITSGEDRFMEWKESYGQICGFT